MQQQEASIVFDEERASSYDDRFAKLAPLRDVLHLLIGTVFSELPTQARILCVGAGTGAELIALAQRFPQWQFTAVEPAAPMLDVCRRKVAQYGIASRCVFHAGYLDSLPAADAFDAATSLLVSHFPVQAEERRNFFRQIAARLRPGGYLASADLASDTSSTEYQSLLAVWLRMLKEANILAEELEKFRLSYERDVAILPPQEVSAIIALSGFVTPILFLQTMLIHAWYARRSA